MSESNTSKVHLFDFPKESVKEIIIGWKTDIKILERIAELLNQHAMEEVQIYFAKPHESNYKMRLLPWHEVIQS
jgi:hypothetical protein